ADSLADENILEHARLRVRPVEDGDLVSGEALFDECRDPGGDESRLRVLVLDLDHANRLPFAELRPELLGLALAVVRDDVVRTAEDRVRGAVVLLQRDRARAGEVALEVEDVVDVGAAKGINGLVRIAHGTNVSVWFGQE